MPEQPTPPEGQQLAARADNTMHGAQALARLQRVGDAAHEIGQTISGLTGWRHAVVATGAGALGVLGMAPFFFVPVLCISLVLLVWLMDGCVGLSPWQAARRGAATGWFFSFGFLFLGLQWVGNAFLVDAETFAWVMPFAVTLLPAGLALFAALALGLAGWLWTLRPERIFLLAAAWTLGEWLRGHLLTGFPWNLLGYVWAGYTEVAQAASLVGIFGMSFLTVAALSSVALLAARSTADRLRPWHMTAAMMGLLLLAAVGGALRVSGGSDGETVSNVKLRIVQPGTRQAERRDSAKRPFIWRNLLRLSADARAQGVTHIIWPEAAPPFPIATHMARLEEIDALLDPGMTLLTGAVRAEPVGGDDYNFYNGFIVFDHQGAQQTVYDKHHLVPFGEYLPFRKILSLIGLRKVADGVGALTPGAGPAALALPGAPAFAPIICYEIIFPGNVTPADKRPGWMVNVTDDDWFGDSIGPRQHLAITRMRAIEENMPVVRAANSGISALIDRFGRVRQLVPLHEVGVIDTALPVAGVRTMYKIWGDWPVLALSILLIAGSIWSMRGRT